MNNKLLLKSLMIAPLALSLLAIAPKNAHADAYTVDPRFAGNPNIGVNQSITTRYSFHHGGNPVLGSDNIWRGGYWAGATNVSLTYKFISMNQMVVVANGASASTYTNSSTVRGGGFYDTNFLAKFGYNSWVQNGVSQPEKKSNYDYSSGLMSYISNQSNGIWYGSTHYNASTSFQKNVYYYERQSGVQSDYLVYGDSNNDFVPFTVINRYFMDNHTQAQWAAAPLGNITLNNADIKWINNTTGADNYTSYKQGYVIAPGGSYNINDNHDSDKKMLSWPSGGSTGKYYTTGDKLVLRNMSPIIQADGSDYGKSKNGGLSKFQPNQVFRQALWIPDGFTYNMGDAKVYAIQTDGSKIDVTDRFDQFYGTYGGTDTVTNWSQDGSTTTNMRRLVFTAKNINDNSTGGYNNAKTVGYSVMVPVTVNATAHTDKPYAIRGGSQIINGVWHDTGTDKIYIWNPSKPVSTTTSANATVFKNDSSSDFTENTLFYDDGSFANNKTFRSNEDDGYYTWHRMIASAAVPDYVLNNKASDSSIAPWQSTQPLVFTIPYDNRYITPIGGNVSRNAPTWTTMAVGTNGITGQDTGSSYVITIPASLVNAYRDQNVDWGAVLKYKVKTNIPGNGVQISSTPSSNDEVSGQQAGDTVYNYLESPTNTFTFDTISKYGVHLPINQFGSNLNDSVHFVNGQEYGYESQFGNIAKVSGSSGVGEPLKKVQLTASIKPNQIVNAANVYKGNTLVWSGYVRVGQTALQGSSSANINGLSASDWSSSFSGTIATSDNNSAHNRTIGVGKNITINASSDLLNNKTALYDTDDLHMVLLTDTDDAANQTNLTTNYGDTGNELMGTLTNSIGLLNDSSSTLAQQVSRVKPGAMIVKHGQWPASLNDNGSSINLNSSSIQGREVFDYRLSQFLGNSNLPTEGYATPFSMTAAYNIQAQPTGVSDITVKAYDLAGNITDVTKQFTITINSGKVSAVMNQDAVNAVTGKVGSAYNKLYVLNVPMKNQTDNASTVRNEIDGSATINGQTVNAPYINEFIPPETPYMYGYSATSTADSFTPSDPEKDKGKIAYGTSDGASTSAQISTAPVQWVIREQLGDISNPNNPQKYAYAKFNVTFPDAALFQNGSNVTWHVYNESGTDVSSKFTGSATTGSGFKIQASDSFLKDMSNYNHKYYFVINQTTQNSHANRLAMAAKAGLGNVFSAFRSLKSAMTAFFGAVGIGNTDKTVATQNFDMQSDMNLLQINSTKSGLNEKMSELNTNPFTNGKYAIQNVALARPLSGYTITGAASQYATDAREYESYTTSFTANGADTAQAVTPGSVKIIDSVTNTDVTSQYNVTISDQKVIVVASQKALDRLHGYHKTAANADTQDIVTFHVDTWGSRQSDTVATWYATHNINGYNDAQSVERVTIPQAHAGHKEIYVSPAGQNKWQTTDMTLDSISEAVDLKIRVTVPNDLHNKDFTDFIAHYVGSEITPFVNQADATATVMLGENNDYSKGSAMVPTNASASSNSLNNSRVLWQLPSTLVTQLNTTNAINAAPTYTVIIHNIRFTPTNSRTIDQYTSYLTKNNQVVIPVGGVTTSSNGSQAPMDGNYFEGRNGAIVDSTIGSLGSGTTLGAHSGKINIILSTADALQEGYVNGGESNTSFTSTGSN